MGAWVIYNPAPLPLAGNILRSLSDRTVSHVPHFVGHVTLVGQVIVRLYLRSGHVMDSLQCYYSSDHVIYSRYLCDRRHVIASYLMMCSPRLCIARRLGSYQC